MCRTFMEATILIPNGGCGRRKFARAWAASLGEQVDALVTWPGIVIVLGGAIGETNVIVEGSLGENSVKTRQ